MTLGDKLARLRNEHNYTQEQLAELLGVSRQAISKWESNSAYPETEKLIRLAKTYGCSLDYLILDKTPEKDPTVITHTFDFRSLSFERVSQRKIGNLPLWHINLGVGRVAKGVFSLGFVSTGLISVGLVSVGLLSFGVLAVGLLALGAFSAGLVSLGAIAAGVLAFGAVAFGLFAGGAASIGLFAVGAAALGNYAAYGDAATAAIAIGMTDASGTFFEALTPLTAAQLETVRQLLSETVPQWLSLFKELFLAFLH